MVGRGCRLGFRQGVSRGSRVEVWEPRLDINGDIWMGVRLKCQLTADQELVSTGLLTEDQEQVSVGPLTGNQD